MPPLLGCRRHMPQVVASLQTRVVLLMPLPCSWVTGDGSAAGAGAWAGGTGAGCCSRRRSGPPAVLLNRIRLLVRGTRAGWLMLS